MREKLKLADIAARINAHLKRLEADKEWNALPKGFVTSKLWCASACYSGNRVFITYVSYQGSSSLKKADAIKYLTALEGGYKGKHWHVPRELETQ